MAKVVTFGEIMLRLAPNGYYRFFQNDQMQATFGGGEANVAVSLANYGLDSVYVTKLPKHAIGQAAIDSLRYFGVDTSKIIRGGERVGIYFLEKGASQRGSVCIYDRAHSAIAEAELSDFDWDSIFDGANWFHFTGITPALSDKAAAICLEACKKANIPYIYGAIQGWVAQAAISLPGDNLIHTLYPEEIEITDKSVLSFTPALCASMQTSLCVKWLLGRSVETGTVYYFDLLNQEFETIPMV